MSDRAADAGKLLAGPKIDFELTKLVAILFAGLGAIYVVLCAKAVITGQALYGFADFHALWVSGVLAHDGQPLINYDADALHLQQVAHGMDPRRENPFPYPPTSLLLLAPLGGLSLPIAYAVFMIGGAAAFLAAMTLRRARDWRWWIGAFAAPAGGIVIVSGQSGFLTGALAIGGFRLAASRPILAGILFGLLSVKPQLGVMIPVALLAARNFRTLFSGAATVLAGAALSGFVFGWDIWPAWAGQLADYAKSYPAALDLMPTVYAGALSAGAPKALGLGLQGAAALIVVFVVWRASRNGIDERAAALALIGTFLATPHAFNYDMPMTSAAIVWFFVARCDAGRGLRLGELVAAALAFALPFLVLALRHSAGPLFFLPLALMFAVLARSDAWDRQSL